MIGSVLVLITGEHHLAVDYWWPFGSPEFDHRVIKTACGERIATIGERPDPTNSYQQAVFPKAFNPTKCNACYEGA